MEDLSPAHSTVDVDLSTELDIQAALKLVASLTPEYYASDVAVREAFQRHSCFNLLHTATAFKVDIFVGRHPEFDRRVLDRATDGVIGEGETMIARIASAEDIILLKLEWYRLGDEVSERQWDDVLRVARLQGMGLDLAYLQLWSEKLGIADLLRLLLSQDPN